MIKKITDPKEFEILCRQIAAKFSSENEKYGHWESKINPESLIKAWGDSRLLNFHLHVWANKEEGYDSVIMFQGVDNHVTGEKQWQEYFWISSNPKVSFQLLNRAKKFGKSLGYKKIVMFRVINYPTSDKLCKVYEKMGFKKDSEMFVSNL